MPDTAASLLPILQRYVSQVNAQVLLQRAVRESGARSSDLAPQELQRVCTQLERGVQLFVDPSRWEEARRLLRQACGIKDLDLAPVTMEVRSEADVSRTRAQGRRLCEEMGAAGLSVQKVTTIISELARNIVSYTPGGEIELIPRTTPDPRMVVCATDFGAGIPHLDQVLGGNYRSRTGMGRGILGCKRLSDRFQIESGTQGTRVRLEVRL